MPKTSPVDFPHLKPFQVWFGLNLLPVAVQAAPTGKTRFVPEYGSYKTGLGLPHVVLKRTNGSFAMPATYKYGAKGTIFAFFQTSCKPCLVGLKELQQSITRLGAEGISITAVHIKELKNDAGNQVPMTSNEVEAWLSEQGIAFGDLLLDGAGALKSVGVISEQGTVTLPLTIAVNDQRFVAAIALEEGADYISGLLTRMKGRK